MATRGEIFRRLFEGMHEIRRSSTPYDAEIQKYEKILADYEKRKGQQGFNITAAYGAPLESMGEHEVRAKLAKLRAAQTKARAYKQATTPSLRERQVEDLIYENIKSQQEDYKRLTEQSDELAKLFGQDYTTGLLTPEEQTKLDDITQTYIDVRMLPVEEQSRLAEQASRQALANRNLLDSSVYGETLADIGKARQEFGEKIGKEAALFGYSTEQDIRQKLFAERLEKIGILQGLRSPQQASQLLAGMQAARNQQANLLLQSALVEAQNRGGGFGFMDFLKGALGVGVGAFAGGIPGAILGGAGGWLSGAGGGGGGFVPGTSRGGYDLGYGGDYGFFS